MSLIQEEIIKKCKRTIGIMNEMNGYTGAKYDEVELKEIIAALENQIPKVPKVESRDVYDEKTNLFYCIHALVCPVCGSDLADHGKGLVCTNSNCRQAILKDD